MAEVPEQTAGAAAVERRIVSVLFADLVGFTPLSERMDAEDVAAIQDAYFAATRETIERYGGTVEKFIGDAAMAVFGAPRARDDDAERAVRAGLALIGAVEQLGARLGLEPGTLRLRVGVNSGEVVFATEGPDTGRVTGDTVNTAARLQAAAEPDSVLVGEVTALAVGEAIELGDVAAVELKGKSEPIRTWRVIRLRPEPSRDAALGDLRAQLLGRDRELAMLESNRGRVTVIAPPGVGKSRLVAELSSRAVARGDLVLRARARPMAASPYEVVAQLLRAAGDDSAHDRAFAAMAPERRAVVAAEVDALLRPPAAQAAEARDIAAERRVRFEAWTDALAALAGGRPAVWIVEDVHWAGGDLLAFLGRPLAGGTRLVATARPSVLEAAPDFVAGAERLDLETLPAADAAQLVRALVGDALPPDLVDAVAERSDGNPLFIEELLRTWASVGTLVRDGGGWRLAVAPSQVALPATVQAIYAAQLDDLPTDARLVARRASVAGRRFPVAALDPLDLEGQADGLDVLRRRAFVDGPQADPLSGDVYAYRHALLRDAGYASLARAERARLHAALGAWLEAGAGDRVGEAAQLIAQHYADAAESMPALGGDMGLSRDELTARAAAWFERAAEAALGLAAPDAAVRLLGRSLELTRPDASVDRARRRLRRGEVLADSAALDEAIVDMTDALAATEEGLPANASLYAEAAYRLGLAYMQQIRFPEAEALTPDAIGRLADADEPAGTARLMALHAWSVAAQGRDEGAGDEARRAREIGAGLDDPVLELDLLEHYAATADELDLGDTAVWGELADKATALGRWRQAAIATRVLGVIRADRDPGAALALHDAAAHIADSHGLTEQSGWARLSRAEALFVVGDWDAALVTVDAAIALGEQYAYERLAFRSWMVALPMLAARRDPSWNERYRRWWRTAEAHFPPTPSPYGTVLRAATAQWLARAAGEPATAVPELPAELPPFSNPHFAAAREIVAEALIETGDITIARTLAEGDPTDDWTPIMRASQALIASWIARADGDGETAMRLGAAAAEHATAIGAAWWVARGLRGAGDAAAAGDLERRLRIAT
jgi:class 3 adenylate cyclase